MTLMGGAFYGCSEKSIIDYSKNKRSNASKESASRAVAFDVAIQNDKLVIQGKDLEGVKKVTVKNSDGFNETFEIESISSSEIIASGLRNFSIAIGKAFSLVLADAHGSSTFAISFSLEDGQVTAQKLSDMGAGDGDVLIYNQASERWEPRPLSGLNLVGTWDANGNIPTLNDGGHLTNPLKGDYYVVSVSGTIPLDGESSWNVGDWVIFNGQTWAKINNTADVQSFAGRQGVITPDEGDYSLDLMSDVDTSAAAEGKVLKYISGEWVAADDLQSGGAGSVTSAEIADGSVSNDDLAGSIDQSKITNLSSDISSINSNVSDNASDIATNTSDIATNLSNITNNAADILTNTNDIGTNTTAIGAINTALGGKQDTIGDGDLTIARTSGLQTALDDKLDDSQLSTATDLGDTSSSDSNIPSQLAVKTYVDTEIAGVNASQWTTSGSDIYYSSGNVGIGATSPDGVFEINRSGTETADPIDNTGTCTLGTSTTSTDCKCDVGYSYSDTNTDGIYDADECVANDDLFIVKNGNVGVGTATPSTKFEVIGDSSASGIGSNYVQIGTNSSADGFVLNAAGSSNSYFATKIINSGANGLGLYVNAGSGDNSTGIIAQFASGGTPKVTVKEDGSVGVGTVSPSEKLDVDGNVKATAFIGDGSQLTGITSDSSENTADAVIAADSDSAGGGDILFNTAGTTKASISNEGDMTLGATINSGTGVTSFSVGSTSEPSVISLGEDSDNNAALTWNNTDNYVSIGTRSGATDYTDTLVVKDGKIGVGTTSPVNKLHIEETLTDPTPNNANKEGNNLYISTIADPTAQLASEYYASIFSELSSETTNNEDMAVLLGIHSSSFHNGIGTIDDMRGISGVVDNKGAGDIDTAFGFYVQSNNSGSGNIDHSIGGRIDLTNSSTGTVNEEYGLVINSINSSTVHNTYGIRISDLSSGTRTNQPYALYSSDSNAKSYFAGNVGIGTANPDAKLEIKGGSSNAGGTALLEVHAGGVSHLMMGVDDGSAGNEYSWIQSHGSTPLKINPVGNHTILNQGSGNVGIGTTSPPFKLSVGDEDSGGDVYIGAQDGVNEGAQINYEGAASNDNWATDIYGQNFRILTSSANSNQVQIFNDGSGDAGLYVEGKVGIGTSSPTNELDVNGSALIGNAGTGDYALISDNAINLYRTSGTNVYVRSRTNGNSLSFGTTTSGGTLNSAAMTIDSDQNVGIGTTNPTSLLHLFSGSGNLTFDPEVDVTSLNPGSTTSAAVIKGTNGRHLILDIPGNDSGDSFAVRTSNDNSTTINNVAMVVKNDGNVGIGTISPEAKFHVYGVAKIERPDGNPQLLLSRDDATITAGDAIGSFVFSSPDDAGNATSYALIEALAEDVVDGSEDGSIRFRGQRDGVLAEHVRILGNGHVGIGTTSPSEKLEVSGKLKLTNGFDSTSAAVTYNDDTDYLYLGAQSGSSANGAAITLAGSTNTDTAGGSGAISFITSGASPAAVITSGGNVGIGTTTPESRLQVSGGGLCVGSDADCNTDNDTEGNIYASTTSITGADYAEYFYSEGRLQAGDLVGLNSKTGLARYYQKGDKLLGIASTKPGVVGNRKLKDADNTVLVALLGQVPVNGAQVVEEDRVVRTLDGKTIGHRLHSGDVYVNISSVDEEQSRKIASLESENNEIKLENKQMRKELDELKGLFKELSRKLEEKQSAQ